MRVKAGGNRLSFVEFQLPTLVGEPPDGIAQTAGGSLDHSLHRLSPPFVRRLVRG